MATPLHIQIAIHYLTSCARYAEHDPEHRRSAAVRRYRDELLGAGMLEVVPVSAEHEDGYAATDGLRAYMGMLKSVPFPQKEIHETWSFPDSWPVADDVMVAAGEPVVGRWSALRGATADDLAKCVGMDGVGELPKKEIDYFARGVSEARRWTRAEIDARIATIMGDDPPLSAYAQGVAAERERSAAEIAGLRHDLSEAVAANATMRNEIRNLTADRTCLRTAINKRNAEYDALSAERDGVIAEYNTAMVSRSYLLTERDELKEKLAHAETLLSSSHAAWEKSQADAAIAERERCAQSPSADAIMLHTIQRFAALTSDSNVYNKLRSVINDAARVLTVLKRDRPIDYVKWAQEMRDAM